MRIAFVYDRVNKFGGAERLLTYLHDIWPSAPLYTAVYDKDNSSWADIFIVKPSYLKFLPVIQKKHEWLLFALPMAFEMMDFDKFDVVLSVTSAEAKGIITKPGTLHICYCLTPTRYLWSGYNDYRNEPASGFFNPVVRLIMSVFFPQLRRWDYSASKRPDYYFSISQTVKDRVKKFYRENSQIIYPPVDLERFKLPARIKKGTYFLIVSRLVPYKNIDYVIKAFCRIDQKLIIIGNGADEKRLKSLAGSNVKFINGDLTDKELCCYYQNCKALIFPGEEDFGLTSLEAQASGRPVIAFYKGGVSETVINGKTGILYHKKDENAIISVLSDFKENNFSPVTCRKNASRFSKKNFQKLIKNGVENLWKEYKTI